MLDFCEFHLNLPERRAQERSRFEASRVGVCKHAGGKSSPSKGPTMGEFLEPHLIAWRIPTPLDSFGLSNKVIIGFVLLA